MEIVHGDRDLERYMARGRFRVSEKSPGAASTASSTTPSRSTSDCISGRHRRHDRRHHGARRTGGHSFGRLRLLAAAVLAAEEAAGRDAPADDRDGQGARRRRPDERAVRDPGRHVRRWRPGRGLRARGQPARVAHRAVRLEGDGAAAGQDRGPLHGRAEALGAAARSRRGRARLLLRQGSRLPVQQVPGRRSDPRARDAVDRRGHGHRTDLRRGNAQEPARRRLAAADQRAPSASPSRTATRPVP